LWFALVVRMSYGLISVGTGFELPASGLVRFVFVFICIVFLIRSGPRLLRKMLWRVRHRLLVTWVLVGVVPIVLICALVGEGLFILMGQVAGYMTTTEISRRSESVRSTAYALGWSVAHRGPSASAPRLAETFVR